MLRRIVRMEFAPDKVEDFLMLFDEVRSKISARQGCSALELCKDAAHDHVYYTFSTWESEDDLEAYRHSDLFRETWARTKILFGGKPQAFSLLSEDT